MKKKNDCQHQFIAICEKTKPIPNSLSQRIMGMITGCVLCGEIRIIYEDGKIEIK